MRVFTIILLLFGFILCNATNPLVFFSSGAISKNSATVVAQTTTNNSTIFSEISTDSLFQNIILQSDIQQSVDSINHRVVKFQFQGLQANTPYFYRFNIGGNLDTFPENIGKFKTTADSIFSFRFVVSGCNQSNDRKIYDEIIKEKPHFLLINGDWHYEDVNSSDISQYYKALDSAIFKFQGVKKMLKSIPYAYVWDDHDYCGNNANGNNLPGANNIKNVYRLYHPHYTLSDTLNNAIYQSFVVGRIKFILTDLRSQRFGSSMMGTSQKNWFKNQVLEAKENKLFIIWVSSVSIAGNESDNWGGYINERKELYDFFQFNEINNMLILCGDAHMLAADNGNNTSFSSNNNSVFKYPVIQAAALCANGSYKGGIYSEGYYPNPSNNFGQYAVIDIEDNGEEICINSKGKRFNFFLQENLQVMNYNFCKSTSLNIEINKSNFPKLYPNPVNDFLVIDENIDKKTPCYLYNSLGKLIQFIQTNDLEDGKLNLSHLSAGMYILVTDQFSYKFLKN